MSAPIEVLELKRVTFGNVRDFVKLNVGGFTIHGVKVIRQENQKPWIALPQTNPKRGNGFLSLRRRRT